MLSLAKEDDELERISICLSITVLISGGCARGYVVWSFVNFMPRGYAESLELVSSMEINAGSLDI
jgi:hypothetical protein